MMMAIVVFTTMIATIVTPVSAASEVNIPAKSALAVDLNTGKILADKNGDSVLPIASMTKILTLYLVRKAVKEKKISFDDKIKVTEKISKLSKDKDLSNVPVTTGEKYTVKELYDSAWIYSSNAAAMLLANKVAGSQEKFVDQMRAQLKKWGIKDAKIVNVSGLNNSDLPTNMRVTGTSTNDENMMSAIDLAVVSRHALIEFPDILDIAKVVKKTFAPGRKDEFVMTSFNRMLPGQPDAFGDLTVDGLKTGTTNASGESFVGTIKQKDFRILTVVMNVEGQKDDLGKRFKATAALMRSVYSSWTPETLYKKGDKKLIKPIKLKYAKEDSVTLETASKVVVWNHNGSIAKTKVETNPSVKNAESTKKGQVFGSVKVADDGLGYLPGTSGDVELVATKTVEKKNFIIVWFEKIIDFFKNLF